MKASIRGRRVWLGLALAAALSWMPGEAAAADLGASVDVRFQNALLQEEGKRDYEAAIREYQAVIEELDGRRRLAAAAVYRLGECYRKLGRTNEAVAQYERLLREFPADESLARLSRQNLAGLAVSRPMLEPPRPGAAMPVATGSGAATDEEAGEIRRIQALVANSPDLVNALTNARGSGTAPLHNAAAKGQLGVVRFLLDHGARVDVLSQAGHTPLHTAVMAGHKATVELLLERGAAINLSSGDGSSATALHLAAQRGFVAIAEVLLARGADVQAVAESTVSGYDGTPLFAAVAADRIELVRLLLAKGADPNRAGEGRGLPLTVAASREMVGLLLESKTDPNRDGGRRLVTAAGAGDLPVVKLLLDAGAKWESEPAKERVNALFAAVQSRRREVAEELLRRGADLNRVCGGPGQSAFHRVVAALDLDWLDWALKNRGDPNVRTSAGQTALELTGVLEQRPVRRGGAGPGSEDAENWPWRRAEILLQHGARPDEPFKFQGGTLAHAVAFLGGVEELGWLVSAGANLNARAERGITPLIVAVCRGHAALVEAFLKAGAQVQGTNDLGCSALHHAAARRLTPVVATLLAAKADPDARDRLGRVPAAMVGTAAVAQAGHFGVQDLGSEVRPLAPVPSGFGQADMMELRRLLPVADAKPSRPAARAGKAIVFGAMEGVIVLEANKPTTLADGLLTLPRSSSANLKRVKVHRAPEREGTPGTMETVNVEELLRTNNRESDPVLQPGDRIEVAEKLL